MNADHVKEKHSTGNITATVSPQGPFIAHEVVMVTDEKELYISGTHPISEDEKPVFHFRFAATNGEQSGEFNPSGEYPAASYAHVTRGHIRLYSAERGTFSTTLIKQTQHFTGNFHFFSAAPDEEAFEGTFNIQKFDL